MEKNERILTRDFYLRDANVVAPELLGKLLVCDSDEGVAAGMIVEVEAYVGSCDKGAHSYPNKRTERTEIQFGLGGYAYVYAIYGMHWCFNVVVNVAEKPECIFVRALEPVRGIELMERRRNMQNRLELCSGPGKLCKALGINKAHYGLDLCGAKLYIEDFQAVDREDIMVSPRINIDYAEECRDYLWRYFIKGNKYVSKVGLRYRERQQSLL